MQSGFVCVCVFVRIFTAYNYNLCFLLAQISKHHPLIKCGYYISLTNCNDHLIKMVRMTNYTIVMSNFAFSLLFDMIRMNLWLEN